MTEAEKLRRRLRRAAAQAPRVEPIDTALAALLASHDRARAAGLTAAAAFAWMRGMVDQLERRADEAEG